MASNLVSLVNKLLDEKGEVDFWKRDKWPNYSYYDKGPKTYTVPNESYVGKKVTEESIEIAGVKVAGLANTYRPKLKKGWEGDLDYLDWDYWFGNSDDDD